MKPMKRSIGKLIHKSPGDNARVSVLLGDYEDADKVLVKIIDNTKSLREAWIQMALTQYNAANEYVTLYDPIVGASDGHGRFAEPTPEPQLTKTFNLKEIYEELKNEIMVEVAAFDKAVITPASDARECLTSFRKTIKKRENKRVDLEKCQEKVNKLQRKPGRTPKEDNQLRKSEEERSILSEEFQIVDSHLRETLPPIITSAFSLVLPLISAHAHIQNRLLGLSYTALHNYCEENEFPSPPPPMEDVVSVWAAAFRPIQKEVESIPMISRGKAVHQPMNSIDEAQRKPSVSSVSSRNGQRTPSGLIPGANGRENSFSQDPSPQPSPRIGSSSVSGTLAPTDFTTASRLYQGRTTPLHSPSPRLPADYFGHTSTQQPPLSRALTQPLSDTLAQPLSKTLSQPTTPSLAPGALAKKKPPPPPPPKKSIKLAQEFVIAQYDFSGQGSGDLSFREGDKIKIVKKTGTDQDWWVGELNGVRGAFPANYCKPT